jgi:hypothetical protein
MSEGKHKEAAPQSIAEDEVICDCAEQVRNGQPINWQYWQGIKAITPLQGAKLAHCIDPIKWPHDHHAQGPFLPDLREKIERLSVWLADKGEKWTLEKLVKVLGRNAPFNMREVAEREAQTVHKKGEEWPDEKLLALLDESQSATHKDLGSRYGVKRQRIGKLLKKARGITGAPTKNTGGQKPSIPDWAVQKPK